MLYILIDEYTNSRKQIRKELVEFKKNRRVAIGPYATFYFESFETMLAQVQEMLYIEKGGDEQLKDELIAYNPLVPNGKELTATVMFEIDNPVSRAAFLGKIGGIEEKIFMKIDNENVKAVSESNSVVVLPTVSNSFSVALFNAVMVAEEIALPFILNVLPDAKLIPESSTSKISVPSTLNVNLPWSLVLDAVAVEKVTDSAVLLLLPLRTSMLRASVALVPIFKDTSALFASSYIVKSPPVSAVIACEASTPITEEDAVKPVPANNVAKSATASFLVALLSLASMKAILSPSAIAPAEREFKLSPVTISVPFTEKVKPEPISTPPSSIVRMSVPSTSKTIFP